MSKHASKPHPDVTEEDREIVREAMAELGKTYFKSRELAIEEYTPARISWILQEMDMVTQWNDRTSTSIAVWRILDQNVTD